MNYDVLDPEKKHFQNPALQIFRYSPTFTHLKIRKGRGARRRPFLFLFSFFVFLD